jgi:Asp-tRNA(Asn)/Glu-tRNA(Gln) amidotransferase A subunit family amidase
MAATKAHSSTAAKPGYDPKTFRPLTFHDAVPGFVEGNGDPRAYLERCIETIEAREPSVRAFVVLNLEGARKAADASAARYRAGKPLSPIDGMPIGIKDLYETADMPTQMGSPLFKGWQSTRDSAAVYALRRSGAIVIGKTVTTELGFYSPGPTRNPFDIDRTPGGSSSGSAAAVGARMVPATIGSQVVGSLIRPSSYCGNIGFKPSLGALNKNGGGTGLSQSCIGVHAGSFEDIWNVSYQIASIAGGDHGYPGLYGGPRLLEPAKPQRLAVVETAGWELAEEAARDKFLASVDKIASWGIEIVTKADDRRVDELDRALRQAKDVTHVICGYELRWPLKVYRDRGPGSLSDDISKRLELWEKITMVEYRTALAQREDMRRKHAAVESLASGVLALSATGPAPVGMGTGDPIFAAVSSILGAPAINLPVLSIDGMPFGIQLIGQPHGDARTIALSRWLMNAFLAA